MIQGIIEGFLIALAAACLAGAAWAAPMRVVVYGDSLTSGHQLGVEESYAGKLSRKIKQIGYDNVEVINLGDPTRTSASGVQGLPQLLAKSPDVVVLQLGNNDIWHGINVDFIASNLDTIMKSLRGRDIYVVLIGNRAASVAGTEYEKNIARMYERLGNAPEVSFYPYVLDGIIGNPNLTLADGYHPNSKGMDVLVEGTFRLVDAGLRARWSYRQQEEYERQLEANYPAGTGKPGAVVKPEGSAPAPMMAPQ